ncbi:hypothetical protein P167DRAFT_286637 [Morchella conica CCBAS932]|uniref:Uncharacterized protein n=1 Tax=Morchella conica CCBAS932 TaxID=1392247 RepID=A0A3N4KGX6_9PEZI|nr:hypothetical protein P167DRAFT_286637 [Morchella conica CCBAS932]
MFQSLNALKTFDFVFCPLLYSYFVLVTTYSARYGHSPWAAGRRGGGGEEVGLLSVEFTLRFTLVRTLVNRVRLVEGAGK